MDTREAIPDAVYRAIFYGILGYFALLLYGQSAGEPLAILAAEFVFGVIAIGVGTVLFIQTRETTTSPALLGAAVCLVAGGMFQFGYLFTRVLVLDQVSSIVVFAGIGLYLYAVWYAE
ncbi:hypothetical protein SAMN04487967_0837 [Natronorubrum sediminis]|uniref:Uncharacterized protein n=1 Tax=Natronorubrum sediminis TaxID=640943 RepID=A0A1H6FNL2_9EURY|nr:hypothetical protein [Natronorubrum sediminis]SEH12499.1 hypothetical protein SAMN04487967_0837 [Natronorubrum sediminis]